MSTQESEGGEDNYEILRTCLKKPCTNLLRQILQKQYKRLDDIARAIPLEQVSDQTKLALEKKNKIKSLHFKVLCDIFQSGVCNGFLSPPAIGWQSSEEVPEGNDSVTDDIIRMWKLWQLHIENNPNETVTDNEFNKALTILLDIGNRLSNNEDFKDLGFEFTKEICCACKSNSGAPCADGIQAGDNNTMEVNTSGSTCVNLVQCGNGNKFIIYHFYDSSRYRVQYIATGCAQASVVLLSEDHAFEELCDSARDLNIEEINELPELKNADISIKEIKRGSLVIVFTVKNDQPLVKNLERIFSCLFKVEKINEVLSSHNLCSLTVSGYIYDPQEYYLDYASEESKSAKFHLYSHSTWKFAECVCDVDVILTDLLYNLLTYDFSTEENDRILILIKGSIIVPDDIEFSSIENIMLDNVDEKIEKLNLEFKHLGHCEIQSIVPKENDLRVIFRTKDCLKYSGLFEERGVIFSILNTFLRCEYAEDNPYSNVRMMRIGLIANTRLIQQESKGGNSSLVIEFQPESKVGKMIETGALPKILTSMLLKLREPNIELPEKMKIEVEIRGQTTQTDACCSLEEDGSLKNQHAKAKHHTKKSETESSGEDSALESDEESSNKPRRLISYQDPEYDEAQSDSNDSGIESITDSQFMHKKQETTTNVFSNTNFVINGLELSDACLSEFQNKRKSIFHYQESLPKRKLQHLLKENPTKYKRCSLYIDSAHKAICTNLNFADEIKEIQISGRSKCGKAFADDEVVVEILGKSKILPVDRKRRNIESQSRDTNVYGKVLGTIKRNRYNSMKHPVLVCALDDFGLHMMKPLCKTVPKIKASHKHSSNQMQFDLYSYDMQQKSVDFKKTLTVNRASRKSYCFLVAIIHWEGMYPFGIILDYKSTKNDPQSGIDILRLQYQIPDQFTKGAEQLVNYILERNKKESKKYTSVFTMNVDDDGIDEMAYSIEKLSSDKQRIGIHIVDPTAFIKKDDYLDKEIRKRGVQYIVDGKYGSEMIPSKLCNLIKFKQGEKRKAVSLSFTCTLKYDIDPESVTLVKSNVICQNEFTIEDVRNVLKKSSVNQDVASLLEFADKLRRMRLGDGNYFCELESGLRNNSVFMKYKEVHVRVQELAIFTNKTISDIVSKKFREEMPYRCHAAPTVDVVEVWNRSHEDMGNILCHLQDCEPVPGTGKRCSVFNIEKEYRYTHLIPFQKNVRKILKDHIINNRLSEAGTILGMDEIHPWQCLAFEDWINVQTLAEYRTAANPRDPLLHFALRLDHYMTFTGPLKRYIDLVAHRFINALISDENGPYNRNEIEKICSEMNDTLLRRKQFYNGCQILLCGHELFLIPQLFNGYVHEVSNMDIVLCYPSLRKLPTISKRIPLNILQTRERPCFIQSRTINRDILEVSWQNRLYSVQRKLQTKRKDNASMRLNPYPTISFQKKQQWINLLKACFKGKSRNLKTEIENEVREDFVNTVQECYGTVDDVSSEDILGVDSTQICRYSLSFNYGQIVAVQIAGEPEHGMMAPMPQLLDLTKNVKICLQHAREPVNVLCEYATKTAKERYDSCSEYVRMWVPILSMEIATLSVEDESYTVTDLKITFSKRGGSFQLTKSFCEMRDISFTVHATDFLAYSSEDEIEKNAEIQPFYVSGSDYLCIRCELIAGPQSKSNFLNGAVSPRKRYWIGHAKIDDIQRVRTPEEMIRVKFICHKKAPLIPQEMLGKPCECHVEIIPKVEVHRRTDMYLKSLNRASKLAKAIAERKTVPPLDQDRVREGKLFCENIDNLIGLKLNLDQRKAVENSVTSSFSLIQGPPGTGKTFTGVVLIRIFCSINKDICSKGGKKRIVLFCGPSNKSVDLVTAYLRDSAFSKKLKILRMYGKALECQDFIVPGKVFSKRRSNKESFPDEKLKDVTLHHIIRKDGKTYANEIKAFDEKFRTNPQRINFKEIKKYKKLIGKAMKEEIPKYDVILCTTSVATGATMLDATRGSIYQVLIDEAGMCTEPECIAVIAATTAKQVILIGDHKQLRPVVICEEAAELGLQKSLFERYAETKRSYLTFLSLQYRMHPGLCEFPSNKFYDGKLRTVDSPKWMTKTPLRLWANHKYPYVFCHIEGEEEYLTYTTEEGNEMSRYNSKEIEHVVSIFSYLVKTEGIEWENINVMSQYNAQCHQIRLALKKQKFEFFNVNTVVASQGGEWDYVIFSLVRSLPEYRIEPEPTLGWCKENLGFITDDHQINVALTRARKGLFVIGNKNLMACEKEFLEEMLEHFRKNSCIVEASSFLPKRSSKSKSHVG